MPTFESPALTIDFSRLPAPKVIEEIDYETLVKIYQNQVVERLPSLARAVKLEQSPTNVVLETEAYGEMLVRARVNSAAKSVMLPFAGGSDIDALAAFYNVSRMPLVAAPRPFLTNPEDWEDDERFRVRVQGAPEAFSMAGTAGSYRFHAMSTVATLRDASAMAVDDQANIKVTLMGSGDSPDVSDADVAKVRAWLHDKKIKPLTDVVSVASVTRKDTTIVADVWLYPGPEASIVKAEILAALTKLKARISMLGRDLTRSAIIGAIMREGVLDVDLRSPAADILCNEDECAWITKVTINISTDRRE